VFQQCCICGVPALPTGAPNPSAWFRLKGTSSVLLCEVCGAHCAWESAPEFKHAVKASLLDYTNQLKIDEDTKPARRNRKRKFEDSDSDEIVPPLPKRVLIEG
jgi:hypothetical protein